MVSRTFLQEIGQSSFWRPGDRLKLLMVLEAYFDESGDQGRFLIAGYVSTQERWVAFEKAWKEPIDALFLPIKRFDRSPPFHMWPCISGKEPFNLIDISARDTLMRAIFPFIPEHALFGMSEGVSLADFNGVVLPNVPKQLAIAKDLRDPYFLCFQLALERLVLQIEELLDIGPENTVACFFDRQDQFGPRALRYFNRLKADEANRPWVRRLRSIAFAGKDELVPLQAADVLAWLSNRFMAQSLTTHPRFLLEEYLRILWSRRALEHAVLTRDGLQEQIARFRAEGKLP